MTRSDFEDGGGGGGDLICPDLKSKVFLSSPWEGETVVERLHLMRTNLKSKVLNKKVWSGKGRSWLDVYKSEVQQNTGQSKISVIQFECQEILDKGFKVQDIWINSLINTLN